MTRTKINHKFLYEMAVRKLDRRILLSTCLTILFIVPFVHGQETPTVLKPNQLFTYSLTPNQEKLFTLQMKKGDFADIQSLAREGLNLSFQIYDSAKRDKPLLEDFYDDEESIWFVAPRDGDFILVSKLGDQDPNISDAQRISIQYNSKFKLPVKTKQKDIRKINGYDIKIMSAPGPEPESKMSIVLIEKSRVLKKILKVSGFDPEGFSFPYPDYLTKTDTAYMSKADIAKQQRTVSLVRNTIDKTGDGIPDVMIQYFSGGAHCCFEMDFINLGETVETVDSIEMGNAEWIGIDKNPKGGLRFMTIDNAWAYWNISFAGSPLPSVTVEFENGKLRPSFDAMKKPPPSLSSLKTMAQSARLKIKNTRYTGVDNCDFECFDEAFWGEMLDLIYSGNEALAWQYFELVWPQQKQGKELFIRDFKKQLLESGYWKMILEDSKK